MDGQLLIGSAWFETFDLLGKRMVTFFHLFVLIQTYIFAKDYHDLTYIMNAVWS